MVQDILKLRQEGKSYNEISKILGCNKSLISYHCKRNNLSDIGLKLSKIENTKEINEYYKTHTKKDTAKHFNISISSVVKYTDNKREFLDDDDRRKRNYEKIKRKRKELKDKAIEYKGGKCKICGYDKSKRSLTFHHRDPNEKEFGISKYKTLSWEKIKIELDKCDLICANCHGELHEKLENN